MISEFIADLDDERLKRLSFNLMNAPLILSDEFRNYDIIWKMIIRGKKNGVKMYELEPWLGMIVLSEVVPGYKAEIDCWIWDKTIFNSPEYIEETKTFFQGIMDEFQLYRLSVETSQEDLSNWLKNFGFKVEGRQKYGFKWNDKMMTRYLVRKIKEV